MDAFISEVRLFAFGFIPKNWAACNGAVLPIAQYQALFALLGTVYGGDGIRNFGLPNLQGRVAVHRNGNGTIVQGQMGGEESHPLNQNEIPQHTHLLKATTETTNASVLAAGNTPTTGGSGSAVYAPASAPGNLVALNAGSVGAAGQGQSHPNLQPFLVLNYCICLYGIYPPRN